VIRMRGQLSAVAADAIKTQVRALLGLDESTPVLVLPEGGTVEVLDTAGQAKELIRRAMAEAQAHPGRVVTTDDLTG
jgi:hypothetical protein